MTISPLHAYVFAAVLLTSSGLALWSAWRRRPMAAFDRLTAGLAVTGILTAGGLGWLAYNWQHGVTFGEERRPVLNRPAPELAFRRVDDDREARLSDYRGKVVLLNLWATWCPPCLEELPELNRFQETYAEEGVVVLTVSDERRETILPFEREEMDLRTISGYLPPGRTWPYPYDRVTDSRPTTFVIDREGIIRDTWPGAESFDAFERAVLRYL